MPLIYALILGIGLAVAFHQAKPMKPLRDWVLINAQPYTNHPWPVISLLAKWVSGLTMCVICLSFWTGIAAGIVITILMPVDVPIVFIMVSGLGSYLATLQFRL